MKVEKIYNHALHGVHQCIMSETMVGLLQPSFHGFKIQTAYLLLLRLQLHDGILKQKELPAHSVVALRCGHLNELLCNINDIHTEILTLFQIHHQIPSTGNNQAVASLETERLSVALKRAIPIIAISMA